MAWNYVGEGYFSEKMMWLNVVRRAIFDYVLYKGAGRNEMPWKRAYAFLFLDEHEEEVEDGLSFEDICGLLDWNIEYVRRLIKSMDRSNVRRLESSKFRHEFSTEFAPTADSSRAPEWDEGVSVPFFRWLTYSPLYQRPLKLRVIPEVVGQVGVGAAWSV